TDSRSDGDTPKSYAFNVAYQTQFTFLALTTPTESSFSFTGMALDFARSYAGVVMPALGAFDFGSDVAHNVANGDVVGLALNAAEVMPWGKAFKLAKGAAPALRGLLRGRAAAGKILGAAGRCTRCVGAVKAVGAVGRAGKRAASAVGREGC